MSYNQIIDFNNGLYHVFARTISGKVYCWGYNEFGVLGNGKNDGVIYKPELNEYLSNKQITDICCGKYYTLVLDNSGEIYSWGSNQSIQIGYENSGENECQIIPVKMNGFNGEKVVMISRGGWHSMTITESGRVFSWGYNYMGQLGHNNTEFSTKPSIISLSNEIPFKKISCGNTHSILLSSDGNIHWFGRNDIDRQIIPKILTINTNKFINIESHYNEHTSIALSENGIHCVWGKCAKEI